MISHTITIVTAMLSGNGKSETSVCRDDVYTVLNNQTFLKVVAQVNNSANPTDGVRAQSGLWNMIYASFHIATSAGPGRLLVNFLRFILLASQSPTSVTRWQQNTFESTTVSHDRYLQCRQRQALAHSPSLCRAACVSSQLHHTPDAR